MIDGDPRQNQVSVTVVGKDDSTREEQVNFDPDFYNRLEKVQNKERERYTGNDAGILAQLALERRWKKDRKKRKVFWWSLILILLFVGVVGYGLYYNLQTVRDQHVRMCAVKQGEGKEGYFVTGQRVYDYTYHTLFGYQLQNKAERVEKSQLNVTGQKMLVVELTGNDYQTVKIGQGEKGTQVLARADRYMFIIDDEVKMISYEGFCR